MNWYSVLYYYYNCAVCIPLVLLAYYRLTYQDYYEPLKLPKPHKVDTIVRLLVSPMVLYYALDSFYIVIQLFQADACDFAFLSHHVVTL